MAFRYAVLILITLSSLISNAGGSVVSSLPYPLSSFEVCQSSGPSFDLTLMPGFADLIPSNEPVTLTLKLRVGVTDPDGVSTVIGSYKNGSSSVWINVSMTRDVSTSNLDDYVASPLNYTLIETNFLVIWDIMFYANDSLSNWNTSNLHQMSVCRQGSTGTAIDIHPLAIVATAAAFAAVIIVALYLLYLVFAASNQRCIKRIIESNNRTTKYPSLLCYAV